MAYFKGGNCWALICYQSGVQLELFISLPDLAAKLEGEEQTATGGCWEQGAVNNCIGK